MVAMRDESCVFCKIVAKEKPASFVYEDEKVIAFLDSRPITDGHTLVIPKKHYATIYDTPEDEVANLFTIVKRAALAVKKGFCYLSIGFLSLLLFVGYPTFFVQRKEVI